MRMMKNTEKIVCLFILAFLGSVIYNCKATLQGAYIHDSFTYPNLVKNRFLIGDVIFADSLEFTGNSDRYARILKEKIINEKFKALPSALYKKKISKKNRKQIKENFQTGLDLEGKNFKVLKRNLTEVKYLVFVVIDFEDLKRKRVSQRDKDSQETSGYISSSYRTISGYLKVYDIQKSILVYSGSTTAEEVEEAEYVIQKKEEGLFGGISSIIKAAKGVSENQDPNLLYPYPDYPTRDLLLQRIFTTFAKSLPEED